MFPRIDLGIACGFGLGILAIVMYLLPNKTPLTITILLVIAFGLSFYIVWTFPWLKESLGRRFAGLLFVAACLCMLGDYVWPRPDHQVTMLLYKIGVRSAIISDNPGNLTLFMVGYKSMYGDTASPVFYLANISITNLQNTVSTIEGYSVAVSDTEKGPWHDLMPISLLSTNLYSLGITHTETKSIGFPRGVYRLGTEMTQKDMAHAALIDPSLKLEVELKKSIDAFQTVGGWAAFDLKDHAVRGVRNDMRITVRDSTGNSFSEVIVIPRRQPEDSETDTQVGSINVIGPIIDMSSFHVRYYSDPYPKASK